MKKVILLGSSGSIGQSACKVARHLKDEIQLVGLAVYGSTDVLLEQAHEFRPQSVAVYDESRVAAVSNVLPAGMRLYKGSEGLTDLVRETEADMVLVAIVGTAGLAPALAALDTGKDLAVASKEILVMAGETVMGKARAMGRSVLPVDSEHNAIFQCIQDAPSHHVHRLILTASGGPFRTWDQADFFKIKLQDALKHPTWDMGRKITIDSATMFNKGLEMIEARWLFGVGMDRIEVVVHPQSIVHSMVEFSDYSILAQLSCTDMCFPIQYALTYPERKPSNMRRLNLPELGSLTFEASDQNKFPALRLAREAGTAAGTLPAVMNAANEIAVDAFIREQIPFTGIWELVEKTMQCHDRLASEDLETIIGADRWARQKTAELLRE